MINPAEEEGTSIVLLGSFNPTIFQPRWLGAQGLIRPEEAENAKITLIQSEVADFSTEWFQLQVLQNRFQLFCHDPRQYAPLRDLAAAVFATLPHTPVTTLGLTRIFHFKTPSVDSWHAIGHLLAPKEWWNEIMEAPGLLSMRIQGQRKKADGGVLRIKVEPSAKVKFGVFIEVSEEFKAPGEGTPDGTQWVVDCLSEHWDDILNFSEVAADHILSLVKN
jgi:hypothetical protein